MIKNKLHYFAFLFIFFATTSWGACQRYNTPTYNIYMTFGRIVVSNDTPVGTVLAKKQWTINQSDPVYYCSGVNDFSARIVAGNMVDLGNNVYSTNVPGIGMRFSRGGSIQQVYPSVLRSDGGRGAQYRLAGSTFTAEIIKTAAVTGSGKITTGKYTTYDWVNGNNPMLDTYIDADAITIVSPSCIIRGGNKQNVDIGSIKSSDLKGVGTVAGGREFNIALECSGGVSATGYANVNIKYDGNIATGTTLSQGVLRNERSDSSAANGVGVQILDGQKKPLAFEQDYNIGKLTDNQTKYINLAYTAQFYQYLPKINSGVVEAQMIFNVNYD